MPSNRYRPIHLVVEEKQVSSHKVMVAVVYQFYIVMSTRLVVNKAG